MIVFKSVSDKLKLVNAITMVGFIIVILLIMKMNSRTTELNNLFMINNSISNEISYMQRVSMNIYDKESFLDAINQLKTNIANLKEKLESQKIKLDVDANLMVFVETLEKSYDTINSIAMENNKLKENMIEKKNVLTQTFEQKYDFKVLQYMKNIEIMEKDFFITHEIDQSQLKVEMMKTTRAIRDSPTLQEDVTIQNNLIKMIREYAMMLEFIIANTTQIGMHNQTALTKELIDSIESLQNSSKTFHKVLLEEIKKSKSKTFNLIIGFILILVVTIFGVTHYISKGIASSLANLRVGLNGFFDFINNKSKTVNHIKISTNDEIGLMSNEINTNIERSVILMNHNQDVLNEANDILQKVANGFYGYKIPHHNNVSPEVKELIINVNKMLDETKAKFDILNEALVAYGNYNFEHIIPREDQKGLYGDFGTLVASTKLIGNNVSELLAMIMNTGDLLLNDTDTLSKNASTLSKASNSQATSLEETAAALEEITANISSNTQNAKKMGEFAKDLASSSSNGSILALQTATAMEDISSQVAVINQAVDIIDQIAFQTNILSLNAAVEAATAGEAGKGFAVVAGEVRNLASRSSEAAKEIKSIVQNALSKATTGKEIADKMKEGYDMLNKKIEQTLSIVDDVSKASVEQLAGIEQINNAVTTLDQNTQINASSSSDISELSHKIAKLSNNLVSASSRAKYKSDAREQVCDVELVYKTAELKNQHILLKSNNFKKIGTYEQWSIIPSTQCEMGKWISECENDDLEFTKSKEWLELKKLHDTVHNNIQEYIDLNHQRKPNEILKECASTIEKHTLLLFDKLNDIKSIKCRNLS